jgi:hypothetical protein
MKTSNFLNLVRCTIPPRIVEAALWFGFQSLIYKLVPNEWNNFLNDGRKIGTAQ